MSYQRRLHNTACLTRFLMREEGTPEKYLQERHTTNKQPNYMGVLGARNMDTCMDMLHGRHVAMAGQTLKTIWYSFRDVAVPARHHNPLPEVYGQSLDYRQKRSTFPTTHKDLNAIEAHPEANTNKPTPAQIATSKTFPQILSGNMRKMRRGSHAIPCNLRVP